MTADLITTSNITFAVGTLGIVFSIFLYFKNPQEEIEKKQAVSEKEIDGRAQLLAEQVKWERDSTEKRFDSMQSTLFESNKLAMNHIHTVDTKVSQLSAEVSDLRGQIIRLSTIIEERIPLHSIHTK